MTISPTFSPNLFHAITTTTSYPLLTFIEHSSVHGGVLNYVWSQLLIPDTSYLTIILLFIFLYLGYRLCPTHFSIFLLIFTVSAITYSQSFLPHPTESKFLIYLYFTPLLILFPTVISIYNRFVFCCNTVISTAPD